MAGMESQITIDDFFIFPNLFPFSSVYILNGRIAKLFRIIYIQYMIMCNRRFYLRITRVLLNIYLKERLSK